MNTQIEKFAFGGDDLRVIAQNGGYWFVLADIARILNIKNPSDIARRLDADQTARFNLGRQGFGIVVNESGFYDVVLRSDKPEAKPFRRWVTNDVLPTIRRHGVYATPATIESMIADPSFAIELLQTLKNEQSRRLQAEVERDRLLHTAKSYTATEIAKELGLRSARSLNQILQEKKIQFLQSGTWVLYSKYADQGYTEIRQTILENDKIVYDRRFTDKGRDFVLGLFEV